MKPSIEKLHKFFKLEAERGYDNHAVVGGLERIVDRWEAEARADTLPEDLIQAVSARLRDYPRLGPNSRVEVLEGIWRRIQRSIEGLPALPLTPAPQPAAAPAPTGQPASPPAVPPAEAERPAQAERPAPEPQKRAEIEAPPTEPAAEETVPEGQPAVPPIQENVKPPAPVQEPEAPAYEERPVFRPAPAPSGPPAALNASITVLPGVGPSYQKTLAKLGIATLRDMLYYFPRRYDDYSQLKPINRLWYNDEVTVIGTVESVVSRPIRGGKLQIVEAVVSDGTGALRINWFNQVWLAKRLRKGMQVALSGKVDQYLGRLVMNSPECEPVEQQQLSTNRIVPVYSLTEKITQRWLRKLMNQVVTYWAPRVQDSLPASLRRSAGLMDLGSALLQAHYPDNMESLRAARHRLAFDEIFLLQMGVLQQKRAWKDRPARVFETHDAWLESQLSRLPFPLTAAQRRSLEDVRSDLASGRPMNRLLQGDVGSGKTIVAALAMSMIANQGAQSALMAPTSILAEQHYKTLLRVLAQEAQPQVQAATGEEMPAGEVAEQPVEPGEPLPEDATPPAELAAPEAPGMPPAPPPLAPHEIRLLVGSTPEAEKREIRSGLADGTIKVLVGTHALIEDPIEFNDLQLAIVDEQHRFGVQQRATLRSKGDNPHLLVMTATPIPRSLALTVYGDLDLSVLDEMPPGRQPVATYVLTPRERERAYTLIRSQVEQGRQAFIIYPLVEESEASEAKAAVEEHAHLQRQVFPKLKLGLLHGRLRPDEKDEVMRRFRDGEYHILVSTSVVEVGVDVPNATVMLIEGANRFGLSQLHQFRGRVGRGAEKSYCLLIPDTPDDVENERLKAMTETNDGFVLAQRDLDQRGPGEFLGTRQSGYNELQLASLTDLQLIEKARRHAQALFEADPDLDRPEHRLLRDAVERFWGDGRGDIS